MCCSCYSTLQHWSRITYTWSTSAAAFTSFYSTALVLSTLGQNVLQRLLHFSALVSYYLHYVKNMLQGLHQCQHCSLIFYSMSAFPAAVTSFFRSGLAVLPLYKHVLQWLIHFTALVSYLLHYVSMCCRGYFIFQHWSRIT
jgi:hypothetical protein